MRVKGDICEGCGEYDYECSCPADGEIAKLRKEIQSLRKLVGEAKEIILKNMIDTRYDPNTDTMIDRCYTCYSDAGQMHKIGCAFNDWLTRARELTEIKSGK